MKVTKENIQEVFDSLSWEEQENCKNLLPSKPLIELGNDSRDWSVGDVLMDGEGKYHIISK